MYTYEYPHPAVTVDCVVFGWDADNRALKVLLIKRLNDPYKDHWALPGGFVEIGEGLGLAARRELEEEAGLKIEHLEQLRAFGDPDRDPRERVITVAYWALINTESVSAGSDAADAHWFSVYDIVNNPHLRGGDKMALAFDHNEILSCALLQLRSKIRFAPLGLRLLREPFTMSDAQDLYESILGRTVDRRNFRRRLSDLKVLDQIHDKVRKPGRPPAALYKINDKAYVKVTSQERGLSI